MNDLRETDTVGIKLFRFLFTRSVRCKGYSDGRIKKNIAHFKLFMYWARKSNHKFFVKRVMFENPNLTPFTLLECMVESPYKIYQHGKFLNVTVPRGFDDIDMSWLLIFYTSIPKDNKISVEYFDIANEWKIFFKNAKKRLI